VNVASWLIGPVTVMPLRKTSPQPVPAVVVHVPPPKLVLEVEPPLRVTDAVPGLTELLPVTFSVWLVNVNPGENDPGFVMMALNQHVTPAGIELNPLL
jgi:hypothetical protein